MDSLVTENELLARLRTHLAPPAVWLDSRIGLRHGVDAGTPAVEDATRLNDLTIAGGGCAWRARPRHGIFAASKSQLRGKKVVDFLNTRVGRPAYLPLSAWLEHGPFAMWLVRRLKPGRIVELGTHHGYSYFSMCQAVSEAGLRTSCLAVDTWQGDEHAGFYDETVYRQVEAENQKYRSFSTLLRKTFQDARSTVDDGSVDLLHIDGRHLYQDVKDDFESWIPKLARFAVVLFHDTEVRERDFGVHQFWAEISVGMPSLNFRHGHGLGVLFRGEAADERFSAVFGGLGNEPLAGVVRDYFSATGATTTERFADAGRLARLETQLAERNATVSRLEAQLAGRDGTVSELEARLAALQARKTRWWRSN